MESNSQSLKINLSSEAAEQLWRQCPPIRMTSRGVLDIKGKGPMQCFFLDQDEENVALAKTYEFGSMPPPVLHAFGLMKGSMYQSKLASLTRQTSKGVLTNVRVLFARASQAHAPPAAQRRWETGRGGGRWVWRRARTDSFCPPLPRAAGGRSGVEPAVADGARRPAPLPLHSPPRWGAPHRIPTLHSTERASLTARQCPHLRVRRSRGRRGRGISW